MVWINETLLITSYPVRSTYTPSKLGVVRSARLAGLMPALTTLRVAAAYGETIAKAIGERPDKYANLPEANKKAVRGLE